MLLTFSSFELNTALVTNYLNLRAFFFMIVNILSLWFMAAFFALDFFLWAKIIMFRNILSFYRLLTLMTLNRPLRTLLFVLLLELTFVFGWAKLTNHINVWAHWIVRVLCCFSDHFTAAKWTLSFFGLTCVGLQNFERHQLTLGRASVSYALKLVSIEEIRLAECRIFENRVFFAKWTLLFLFKYLIAAKTAHDCDAIMLTNFRVEHSH